LRVHHVLAGVFRLPVGRAGRKARAQDLFYEAMEAEDPAVAYELLEKSLEIDPDCIDALLALIDAMDGDLAWRIDKVREVVSRGEQDLGEEFLRENRGHFWGLVETRPYMRARERLAGLLIDAGRLEEAFAEYEAMLDLNPNDNQGVRDVLLGQYLTTGRLDAAERLLTRYEDDGSAVFTWGRVLARFLAGDPDGARESLALARRLNRHAEKYLTGVKRLPRSRPDTYTFGQDSEAVVCADFLREAWRKHPAAVAWLKTQAAGR
jgi:tetratricopeptide (TPR) repeat protein